jgi:hypothetical protein
MAVPLPSDQGKQLVSRPAYSAERAGRTVVAVDERDGVVERVRLDDDENGPKDLLLVAVHLGRRLEDGRTDKVAVGVTGD